MRGDNYVPGNPDLFRHVHLPWLCYVQRDIHL